MRPAKYSQVSSHLWTREVLRWCGDLMSQMQQQCDRKCQNDKPAAEQEQCKIVIVLLIHRPFRDVLGSYLLIIDNAGNDGAVARRLDC